MYTDEVYSWMRVYKPGAAPLATELRLVQLEIKRLESQQSDEDTVESFEEVYEMAMKYVCGIKIQ